MKCKIGGREVELDIEGRVRSGVVGTRKVKCPGMATGLPMTGKTDLSGRRTQDVLQPNRRFESFPAGGPRGNLQAGSNPAPAPPSPYKSKWEANYAIYLDALKLAGEIVGWWYEPVRFRLPGMRNFYKADFLILRCNAIGKNIEIHEVKGWSRTGARVSRSSRQRQG